MKEVIILSFQDVTVRKYNKLIFEGLHFTLKSGENWAIVGKSGTGKTVLLEALAGGSSFPKGSARYPLLDQLIAELKVDNERLKVESGGLEGAGRIDRFSLISHVSARHRFTNLSNTTDLYYQQRFNSTDSEDSQTVREYLSAVRSNGQAVYWTMELTVMRLKLAGLLDKQIIKLSNGETKRLLLAAALIRNPVLLLLDNPLTGLDVTTRAHFNDLLKEIVFSGITIVMATNPDEIPGIITRVALLKEPGTVQQMPRSIFPDKIDSGEAVQLNTAELDDLLVKGAKWDYKLIAGMDNVTIRYGKKTILENINWQIRQGERWMLTGPNGSGKSTLLSLINGDNPQAFANNIILFDKKKGSGESIWEIKSKIGFVSPELFQYFPMENSCLQVVESGFYDTLGLFRKSSEKKAAVCHRWMKLLQIEQFEGTLFKNVSVSVQRLCLLARAMVKNPPLLIFDEPCQGLDHAQQERFKRIVDEICKRSTVSVIYVSHYEDERPGCITGEINLL